MGRTIVGYPMCLEATKYDRNAYFFSLGIVLTAAADPRPFYPLLAKFATFIETLELESEFLYRNKHRMEQLLHDVFSQLKAYGDCAVLIGKEG